MDIKVNIDLIGVLERTGNDLQLIEELVNIFEQALPNYRLEADKYLNELNQENYKNLASLLHKLKSSVGTLGFVDIFSKIQFLETELKKNNININYSIEIFNIFIALKIHVLELKKKLKNNNYGNISKT